MAEQFSRRSFLKGGALTVGGLRFWGLPQDRCCYGRAAGQMTQGLFHRKDIQPRKGCMKGLCPPSIMA